MAMWKETIFRCCKCNTCGRLAPTQNVRRGKVCACQTNGMSMLAQWDTVKQEGFCEGTW